MVQRSHSTHAELGSQIRKFKLPEVTIQQLLDFLFSLLKPNQHPDLVIDLATNTISLKTLELLLESDLKTLFNDQHLRFFAELNALVVPIAKHAQNQASSTASYKKIVFDHEWTMSTKKHLIDYATRIFKAVTEHGNWGLFCDQVLKTMVVRETIAHPDIRETEEMLTTLTNNVAIILLRLMLQQVQSHLPDRKHYFRHTIAAELLTTNIANKVIFDKFRERMTDQYLHRVCRLTTSYTNDIFLIKDYRDYRATFEVFQQMAAYRKVLKNNLQILITSSNNDEAFQILGRYGKYRLNVLLLSILEKLKLVVHDTNILHKRLAEFALDIAEVICQLYLRRNSKIDSAKNNADNQVRLDDYMEEYEQSIHHSEISSVVLMVDSLRKLSQELGSALINAPDTMKIENSFMKVNADFNLLQVKVNRVVILKDRFPDPDQVDNFRYLRIQVDLRKNTQDLSQEHSQSESTGTDNTSATMSVLSEIEQLVPNPLPLKEQPSNINDDLDTALNFSHRRYSLSPGRGSQLSARLSASYVKAPSPQVSSRTESTKPESALPSRQSSVARLLDSVKTKLSGSSDSSRPNSPSHAARVESNSIRNETSANRSIPKTNSQPTLPLLEKRPSSDKPPKDKSSPKEADKSSDKPASPKRQMSKVTIQSRSSSPVALHEPEKTKKEKERERENSKIISRLGNHTRVYKEDDEGSPDFWRATTKDNQKLSNDRNHSPKK